MPSHGGSELFFQENVNNKKQSHKRILKHVPLISFIRRHIGDRSLRLSIWDTAGQERYRSLTSIYYRGASGALIFYDITRRSTFDEKIEEWVNEVRSSASQGISIVVVGNKVDDEANRQVSTREGMACAEMLGVPFFEISAKTGTCVAEAFTKLAELIMEDQNLSDGSDGESDNDNVEITDISVDNQENEGNCAC